MNIDKILQKYTTAGSPLGARLDREAVRRDLDEVMYRNDIYFRIYTAMLVVLFASMLAFVWMNIEKIEAVKAVTGIFGVSLAGLIALMLGAWREKSRAELMVMLATHLGERALKDVLTTLRHGNASTADESATQPASPPSSSGS